MALPSDAADPSPAGPLPAMGVVLVTYNAADVILDSLEGLLASPGVALTIAVVDNDSTDGTAQTIRDWAAGRTAYAPPEDLPFELAPAAKPLPLAPGAEALGPVAAGAITTGGTRHRVMLIETGVNSGFAGGVNRGLEELAKLPELDRFWILNPDATVPPETARAFATAPGGFSLMGGRVLYLETPDVIQIDGGTLRRRDGVTGNIHLFASHRATPAPKVEDMAFITGASMVASRDFYEATGPMAEDYFLYYEEVDWALRRGALPLAYCAQGIVYHRGGTAIGSPTPGRPASPFSLYFKHRARMMFMRRHLPGSVMTGHLFTIAKAGQYLLKGFVPEVGAMLAGAFGLAPPAAIRRRLSPEALRRIGR
ncbi:glycosyltransferase family 2 protein [Frigidibacter sp. MR17.24]|uniref:glycosyltransferase family 2 protein n=1 Tax=Frigidibacter sp. MR17.24 TaxID=3127345 RepID=UPI003013063E